MSPRRIDVTDLLRPYAHRLSTRLLLLEQDLVRRSGSLLKGCLPGGTWLLVADPTTWTVAGESSAASLSQAGVPWVQHMVRPAGGETAPVADETQVAHVRQHLVDAGCAAAVAVGSGTVNDIVKTAADELGLPYAVLATAPSMNGYTSSISALLSQGVKITRPARPPLACLVDLDVMAAAPYRMLAAGLGDLVSKPVSLTDWRLARRLLGEEYARDIVPFLEAGEALLDGVAEGLPARDVEAVGRLSASLCLSGLAMGLVPASAPTSGGEHLISHYLDMTHFAWDEPHDLHGCQVGVATLTTASLYALLGRLSPEQVDIESRVRRQLSWDTYRRQVEERFGTLSGAVLEHARRAHPEPEELRARLDKLKREWSAVKEEISRILHAAADLRTCLRTAAAPTTFADIGIARERAWSAIVHSKDIRARYTILHLGADLGLLERWADHVLDTQRC